MIYLPSKNNIDERLHWNLLIKEVNWIFLPPCNDQPSVPPTEDGVLILSRVK